MTHSRFWGPMDDRQEETHRGKGNDQEYIVQSMAKQQYACKQAVSMEQAHKNWAVKCGINLS